MKTAKDNILDSVPAIAIGSGSSYATTSLIAGSAVLTYGVGRFAIGAFEGAAGFLNGFSTAFSLPAATIESVIVNKKK